MWLRNGKPDVDHDVQRHARGPGGDHRAVRLRELAARRSLIGAHRGRARRRSGVLRRAEAQGRRSRRRHRGARRLRRVGRRRAGPFADGTYGDGLNGVTAPSRGCSTATRGQLVASLIGIAVNFVWWCRSGWLAFKLGRSRSGREPGQRRGRGCRASTWPELGMPGYAAEPGHAASSRPPPRHAAPRRQPSTTRDSDEPGAGDGARRGGPTVNKMEAIIKPSKLDEVKAALGEPSASQGMTVCEVRRVRPDRGQDRGLPGIGIRRGLRT